jgi:hypothetical protein
MTRAASSCARSASFASMRPRCQLPAATNTATATIVATVGSASRQRGRCCTAGPAVPERGDGSLSMRATARVPVSLGMPAAAPCATAFPAMKIIVVGALLAVIASLFSALYFLYRDRGHGTRMLKMLALRVALSASLVVFLVVSYRMGWIAPTGLR